MKIICPLSYLGSMSDSLQDLIEEIQFYLESPDRFYVGPPVTKKKGYYHDHQVRSHQTALAVGARAFELDSKNVPVAKKIKAHLRAAAAHRDAAKQLGSFGGSRQHVQASDKHLGAAEELKAQSEK